MRIKRKRLIITPPLAGFTSGPQSNFKYSFAVQFEGSEAVYFFEQIVPVYQVTSYKPFTKQRRMIYSMFRRKLHQTIKSLEAKS